MAGTGQRERQREDEREDERERGCGDVEMWRSAGTSTCGAAGARGNGGGTELTELGHVVGLRSWVAGARERGRTEVVRRSS